MQHSVLWYAKPIGDRFYYVDWRYLRVNRIQFVYRDISMIQVGAHIFKEN